MALHRLVQKGAGAECHLQSSLLRSRLKEEGRKKKEKRNGIDHNDRDYDDDYKYNNDFMC